MISVIVPVYNTEKYLKRCIDSILAQTYTDLEIILVDDGSKDSSGIICDEYAKQDQRIKVVHKKNGGLSCARNAGLRVATGEYIGFVDSDDTVNENIYQALFDTIKNHNVDFVMSDYDRRLDNGNHFLKTLQIREGYYSRQQIRSELFPSLIMSGKIEYGPLLSVWHCLYKTEFLRKYNLEFDEQVRWSEDNIFSAFVGYYAESFYYLKGKGLYHYYQNSGSITTSYRKGSWDVYRTMNEHLHEFFDSVKDYDFSQQLKWHMLYYACNCVSQTVLLSSSERKEQIRMILNSKELDAAFKNVDLSGVTFKLRVQLMLMKYKCINILEWMLVRRK